MSSGPCNKSCSSVALLWGTETTAYHGRHVLPLLICDILLSDVGIIEAMKRDENENRRDTKFKVPKANCQRLKVRCYNNRYVRHKSLFLVSHCDIAVVAIYSTVVTS